MEDLLKNIEKIKNLYNIDYKDTINHKLNNINLELENLIELIEALINKDTNKVNNNVKNEIIEKNVIKPFIPYLLLYQLYLNDIFKTNSMI